MITIKIKVKPHLAEYLYGKYNNGDTSSPIRLSECDDLYHMKWQLLQKRPSNISPIDTGNLEFELDPKHCGKNPNSYNYLDKVSQEIMELKIEALFFLELHTKIEDNRMDRLPITTQQVVHTFMCEYGIDSISEDALIKNNYRMCAKVTKRTKKRSYNRTVK